MGGDLLCPVDVELGLVGDGLSQDVAYRLGDVKSGAKAEGCVDFPAAPELGPLDGKPNRTNSLDE